MALRGDDGQWIILLGFLVSMSLIFLAITVNESMLVGQTTAESVLDFSKNDIVSLYDLNSRVLYSNHLDRTINPNISNVEIETRTLSRLSLNSIAEIKNTQKESGIHMTIHYNNGVTMFNATKDYKF